MKSIFEKIKLKLIYFIARRLRNCKNLTPLYSQSLDRKLPLRTRLELKLHLFTCEACVRYFSQIKFLREAMQKQAESFTDESFTPKEKLTDEAKKRIKKAVRSV